MVLRVVGSNPIGYPLNPEKFRVFLFMYYVYILKSLKDQKYYYGHTADLNSRLKEHNYGKVKATKGRRPLVIHYSEEFPTKSEAAKRELFFKSIDGYIFLKRENII